MKKIPQKDELTTALFSTMRLFRNNFKSSSCKFSVLQIKTLHFILETPSVTMKDIAQFLDITPPSATSLVDGLVKSKYVKKIADEKDLRKTVIVVTPSGKQVIEKANKFMSKKLNEVFSCLNETERKTFIKILNKLNQSNSKKI